jgi:hypothetical protein
MWPIDSAAHACCCSARPVVTALMPQTPPRPRAVELLFCGHHFRSHRHALTAAGATIFDAAGIPIDSPNRVWDELEAALAASR